MPDERLGECLGAAVVADGRTEAEVIERVADRHARDQAPTRVAFSNEPLPRNALDKVDKVALRKAWPTLIGEQ